MPSSPISWLRKLRSENCITVVCILVRMKSFSRFWRTIYSSEINDTSYESQADFNWEKNKKLNFLKNKMTSKNKVSFSSSTNIQLPFGNIFYNLKSRDWCYSHRGVSTDEIVRLSKKSNFTVKISKNAFLTINMPFVRQPDNFIVWATFMLM